MKQVTVLITLVVSLVALGAVSEASAKPKPLDPAPQFIQDIGPTSDQTAKASAAAVDTFYLLGGPGSWDGSFENAQGQPDWHGWTHKDATIPPGNHWHTSPYMADALPTKEPGNHAMYCGDEALAACDPSDSVGGYTSKWFEEIGWSHTVTNTGQPVTVHLTGLLRHDTEPGYDYVTLILARGDSFEILASWDDLGTEVLDYSAVIAPGDYTGPGGNEIRLAWRFNSDGSFDDRDCQFPTRGACQIDDLTVAVDSVPITFDDFEPGSPVNWTPTELPGVGDFSNLRQGLGNMDPCGSNSSYQVNFIDDGVVVPGTGGTPCISWCYGPGGWIVNNDGGLIGDLIDGYHLDNRVISPPMAWPAGAEAADLAFDVYRHEAFNDESAGIVFTWFVRSTASSDPADLEGVPWDGGNGFFFGGPDFKRMEFPLFNDLDPDRQWIQVALAAMERGFAFGYPGFADGPDGTPAPYFDNVAVRAWAPEGPLIEVWLGGSFTDAFPASGVLDPADLAANYCFVDRPGSPNEARLDSMVVGLESIRHGATMNVPPVMHWIMECNAVFDPVRSETPSGSGTLRGSVEAVLAHPYVDRWAFDLPDTGFFFPGDRLRWYITASDDVAGDVRTSVWPADTTGIADFAPGSSWTVEAEICGLPSVSSPADGVFHHPSVLLIDIASLGGFLGDTVGDMTPWLNGLAELGLERRIDFDMIRITSGLYTQLDLADFAKYETILFVAGANPNAWHDGFNDDVFDELLVLEWLDLGGRRALFSGEQVTGSIRFSTPLENRLGVDNETSDITTVNGGARELQVTPVAWQGVLPNDQAWRLSDGCPDARFTEAIIVVPGVGQMAASLDPVGSAIGTYAGLVATEEVGLDNRTLVMPFDLSRIEGYVGGGKNGLSPQADFLSHLLTWLDTGGVSAVDETPGVRQLSVSAHPNPFNPATTISFALPSAGAVTLEIFDVQGRKVRTLINDQRYEAGHHEQPWDGRDEGGRGTSSGVYFYRFATGSEERVGKLTLLK